LPSYIVALLRILTGRDTSNVINESSSSSLTKLERIAVVAQTPIKYSQKQLLQLIHHHLVNQGFPYFLLSSFPPFLISSFLFFEYQDLLSFS
jgi:hypothetical protein